MSVGKASIKRAASAEGKKTVAGEGTKQGVISPVNAEEIQVKFLTGNKKMPEKEGNVRILEELPNYLL